MKTIYGLYVEGEDTPRYVGAAKNIRSRVSGHLNAIRFTKAIYRIDLPDLGLQIRAIEEAEEHNWKEREQYWIDHFTELGIELANADPDESRIKKSRSSIGRHFSSPGTQKSRSRKIKRYHRWKREARMESLGLTQSIMDI